MTVLVVEDHPAVADVLRIGLEESGYSVTVASDGLEGQARALAHPYDLLVVDWMLPGQDGPSLIRRLRGAGHHVPILMLTARAETSDEIGALACGADDYLAKPFSFDVLLARLQALARRPRPDASADAAGVRMGPLWIDAEQRRASVEGVELELREKEFQLLLALIEAAGRLVSRTSMAERVWGNAFISDDVLNTTVAHLRRSLKRAAHGAAASPVVIETKRGVGYRLCLPAAAAAA